MAHAEGQRVTLNMHLGTMGWSYGFWKGKFYPEDSASKDYLRFYASRFNSVEVDNTFYRIPRVQTVEEWKQQTPARFTFSLKFPQKITHIKMLKNCQEETTAFLNNVEKLQEKLGVLLLQFPPLFRQQHFTLLKDYLQSLPKEHHYAVEVRNKSLLNEEVYSLLRSHNVALAWADAAKMPLVNEATADFLYVRWEGDRKTVNGTMGKTEADRINQIQAWAEKLKPVLDSETHVFGYFSKYYSGFPPSDVGELLRRLQPAYLAAEEDSACT